MEEIETGSESQESGESTGSTSEASNSQSDNGSAASAPVPKQEQDIDWSKAFEHPRFKEVIGQKNEALSKYQEMESRYKALENQLNSFKDSQPKAPTETDQLIADLKKVDPRLANVIEAQLKSAKTAEAVQQRLEQFERQAQESSRQQTISNAVSKINSLHESAKMSDFGKQFINNQLDIAYRSGNLNASDLKAVETAYKQAADVIKAYDESSRRSTTESYVKEKAKDAGVPASLPKGTQAKPAQKPLQVPRDRDALKAAVVKEYAQQQAAQKAASNN